MIIKKKYKCLHCGSEIECDNGVCALTCNCQRVKTYGETIVEGKLGTDYVDLSKQFICG